MFKKGFIFNLFLWGNVWDWKVSMRNQGTWSGSIALQKKVPQFASDISVMLSALGANLTILDYSSADVKMSTMSVEHFVMSKEEKLIVINAQLLLPAELERSQPIATFGKIMSRAAMSAGSLTYAFYSEMSTGNSRFFTSSTSGFKLGWEIKGNFPLDRLNAS